jgi:hypothetical protein
VNPPDVGGHNSKASSALKPCSITQYARFDLNRLYASAVFESRVYASAVLWIRAPESASMSGDSPCPFGATPLHGFRLRADLMPRRLTRRLRLRRKGRQPPPTIAPLGQRTTCHHAALECCPPLPPATYNPAAQQSPAVPRCAILSLQSTGGTGSETARFHHAARRRRGGMAARGAGAAADAA